MKGPSPLVPQGSFESQAGRKPHVRIAVYTILGIHVVVLGGLLILGCKREDKEAGLDRPTNELGAVQPFTNAAEALPPATNPPVTPTDATALNPGFVPPPATNLTPPVAELPVVPVAEHKIQSGESFSTLAGKYGVTVKAIQAANPGVDSTKLKIGQVVKIPPKVPVTANSTGTASAADADSYTVKSGDSLSKIASSHGTTVRELQKLNNLTTTQIKVGQKLKLPPRAAPAPAPAQ